MLTYNEHFQFGRYSLPLPINSMMYTVNFNLMGYEKHSGNGQNLYVSIF